MARRVILAPTVNMVGVILDKTPEKTVTLDGKERALISSMLGYAVTHGPAIYGMKQQRNNNEDYNQFIRDTKEKVDSNHPVYTPFSVISSDESQETTVTLSGSERRLIRTMLAWVKGKGHDLFSVSETEENSYDAFVSGLLNTLSE